MVVMLVLHFQVLSWRCRAYNLCLDISSPTESKPLDLFTVLALLLVSLFCPLVLLTLVFLLLLLLLFLLPALSGVVVPIDVAQVPPRLNHVPDAPLELLGLGEAAVDLAVPERRSCYSFWSGPGAGGSGSGGGGGGGGWGLVVDGDDEDAACFGLEGYFA